MSSPQNSGSVQGGITASAGVVSVIVANYADVAIQLAGTFVGTVQFEVTINNDTWAALSLTPSGGGSPVTSATDVGTWQGACGGYYAVRVRCSAFTSGPIYVAINASTMRAGASVVQVDAGLSGTGTIGDPLSANVDGTTIDVNGSNQLEALGAAVAFKTIAVSGQSNIVADAADDTLTIVAGSNITLTTNAGTDTLTIAASGGGGGSPGGSDTQIQFNDHGAFAGNAALTWNGTALSVTGDVTSSGSVQGISGQELFLVGAPEVGTAQIIIDSGAYNPVDGATITLQPGDAKDDGMTLGTGGDVYLATGAGVNGGRHGAVIIVAIPTSATGLPSGAIWNSGGILHIVT